MCAFADMSCLLENRGGPWFLFLQVYTLLFAQESQRQVWLEAISSAKDTGKTLFLQVASIKNTPVGSPLSSARRSDSLRIGNACAEIATSRWSVSRFILRHM